MVGDEAMTNQHNDPPAAPAPASEPAITAWGRTSKHIVVSWSEWGERPWTVMMSASGKPKAFEEPLTIEEIAAKHAASEPTGELPDKPGVWQRDGIAWVVEFQAGECMGGREVTASGYVQWRGFHSGQFPRGGWTQLLPANAEPTKELDQANADYHALESELSAREPVGLDEYSRLLSGGPEVLDDLRAEWKRLRMAIAGHFGPGSLADYSPVSALERACDIEMRQHWHTFTSPTNDELSRLRAERDEYSHAYTALVHGDPLPDGKYPHTLTCNADHRQPIGCDMCSCHVGRPIKKLRAAEAQLTALRQRLERAEGALREIAEGHPPSSHFPRCHLDGERAMEIARAALEGVSE
jgi:hypothetical protein